MTNDQTKPGAQIPPDDAAFKAALAEVRAKGAKIQATDKRYSFTSDTYDKEMGTAVDQLRQPQFKAHLTTIAKHYAKLQEQYASTDKTTYIAANYLIAQVEINSLIAGLEKPIPASKSDKTVYYMITASSVAGVLRKIDLAESKWKPPIELHQNHQDVNHGLQFQGLKLKTEFTPVSGKLNR